MTNETQTFTGLTGNFTTSYGYELSGRLKSVTDAFSDTVYYNNDAAGRTTSITGSSFGGVTSYAGDIDYRFRRVERHDVLEFGQLGRLL